MAKEVLTTLKLNIRGGYANPAPPVGPALGSVGVNIMEFCKDFNHRTQGQDQGLTLKVTVTVYKDKSFTFTVSQPTTADLLRKCAGISMGSKAPGKEIAGSITQLQLIEIARLKMPDMNARDLEAATRTIAGTARSMGIEIVPG